MEHPENVNVGIEPEIHKLSIKNSGYGIPRKFTQLLGLTNSIGALQHRESRKHGIGPKIRKAYLKKSGFRIQRLSSQLLGLRDGYMSWLAGGMEHPENVNAGIEPEIRKVSIEKSGSGIGPDIKKGGGFGTPSIQGTRPYVYSPYASHVGVESSFDSPSFFHMGLGPHLEHSHGK